jgi:Ca2+/H+ antiporter, TMEM165/GDT1 family
VAVGALLGTNFDLQLVQIIAAASFILFGLWTIRGDTLDGEDKKPSKFGPITTVAIAFFIAEMGDKTQLATVALAAKYPSPLATLMGTTTGMMIADGLGIYVGVLAGRKISERLVKWISAMIFIIFGYIGLYTSLPKEYINLPNAAILTLIVVGVIYFLTHLKGGHSTKSSY